jgi:hypothetical protein
MGTDQVKKKIPCRRRKNGNAAAGEGRFYIDKGKEFLI